MPRTRRRPRALMVGRAGERRHRVGGREAVAAEAGVDLDLHGAADLGGALELVERAHPEVDVRGHGGGDVDVGIVQPGQHGGRDPGLTQRERFPEIGDSEPVDARVGERAGDAQRRRVRRRRP